MTDIIQTLRDTYASNPAKALNMLPELFKQYDEGLIKVLPCKVGDTVWIIFNETIHREHISSFQICGPMRPNFCIMNDGMDDEPEFKAYCHYDDFGTTVFLTRPEAERRLESEKK